MNLFIHNFCLFIICYNNKNTKTTLTFIFTTKKKTNNKRDQWAHQICYKLYIWPIFLPHVKDKSLNEHIMMIRWNMMSCHHQTFIYLLVYIFSTFASGVAFKDTTYFIAAIWRSIQRTTQLLPLPHAWSLSWMFWVVEYTNNFIFLLTEFSCIEIKTPTKTHRKTNGWADRQTDR